MKQKKKMHIETLQKTLGTQGLNSLISQTAFKLYHKLIKIQIQPP